MDSAPAAARERPRTRARVRTTHLAPAALRVACDHALFEFLAPWMRNGCALYAANKEIQRGAVLYRRRRLGKLAALRREVLRLRDENAFVNLAKNREVLPNWYKITGVRGDTVILEQLFKAYYADNSGPHRFPTKLVRLERWRYCAVARRGVNPAWSMYHNWWIQGVYMYATDPDDELEEIDDDDY